MTSLGLLSMMNSQYGNRSKYLQFKGSVNKDKSCMILHMESENYNKLVNIT